MTQALYRRYRPQTFSEIVGQKHVADTLRNALRQQRIGHAYLFTGPRGTGKTSTARILAKAVNCLAPEVDNRPDNTCSICQAITEGRFLDLIEIDAASNTSVDDVRELRDRVAFAPNEARYKVYVIDEVHMLSTSAFNALLKTLEEPPAHVIFILATTEPHKIPATILSRCQRFDFHRIGAHEIVEHLGRIAEREGVQITPEALAIIARSATGSMRDAISLLDQITAYGHVEIDAELVRDVLGMVSGVAISTLAGTIASGDPATVLSELHDLIAQGVELNQLVAQLIDHLRTLLLLNVGRDASLVDLPDVLLSTMKEQASTFTPEQLLHTIRALNEAGLALKTSLVGYLPVELALLDAVGLGERETSVETAPPLPTKAPPLPSSPSAHRTAPSSSRPTKAEPQRSSPPASPAPDSDLQHLWHKIILQTGQFSTKTQAMLRSGQPVAITDDAFVISFRHAFHLEQTQADIDTVTKVVAQVCGRPLAVRLLDEESAKNFRPASAPSAEPAFSPQSTPQDGSAGASSPAEDPLVRMAIENWGAKVKAVDSKG